MPAVQQTLPPAVSVTDRPTSAAAERCSARAVEAGTSTLAVPVVPAVEPATRSTVYSAGMVSCTPTLETCARCAMVASVAGVSA